MLLCLNYWYLVIQDWMTKQFAIERRKYTKNASILLRSVIGSGNSCQSLNQSDTKLTPITAWSLARWAVSLLLLRFSLARKSIFLSSKNALIFQGRKPDSSKSIPLLVNNQFSYPFVRFRLFRTLPAKLTKILVAFPRVSLA